MKRADPQYMKTYWAKNAEQLRAKGRERYAKNRERYIAITKAYTEKNYAAVRAKAKVRWDKKSKEEKRAIGLRKFDLSTEQYDLMVAQQNGKCATCRRIPLRLCVDHCHATGVVRGLLCPECNSALGLLQEDQSRIRALADYISKG